MNEIFHAATPINQIMKQENPLSISHPSPRTTTLCPPALFTVTKVLVRKNRKTSIKPGTNESCFSTTAKNSGLEHNCLVPEGVSQMPHPGILVQWFSTFFVSH